MPTIASIHHGMAESDILMGDNQCSYAENVYIRNPEIVTLAQKPQPLMETGTDLALCHIKGGIYAGENMLCVNSQGESQITKDQAITSLSGSSRSIVGGTTIAGDELVLLTTDDIFFKFVVDGAEVYKSQTPDGVHGYNGSTYLAGLIAVVFRNNLYMYKQTPLYNEDVESAKETSVAHSSTLGSIVYIHEELEYIKAITSNGGIVIWDGHSAKFNRESSNKIPITHALRARNGAEYAITGAGEGKKGLAYVSGDSFQHIAQEQTSPNIENRTKFNFGKKNQRGLQHSAVNGDVIHLPAQDRIYAFGSDYTNIKGGLSIEVTHNSKGDKIAEIGMIHNSKDIRYIEQETEIVVSEPDRTYFSWRDEQGNCGIDYIDVGTPTQYVSEGVFYSKKYIAGDKKTTKGFTMRADTSNGTRIDVYASVDGGEYEHRGTHTQISDKVIKPLGTPLSYREIQLKIVLTSHIPTETPSFRHLSFA